MLLIFKIHSLEPILPELKRVQCHANKQADYIVPQHFTYLIFTYRLQMTEELLHNERNHHTEDTILTTTCLSQLVEAGSNPPPPLAIYIILDLGMLSLSS